MERPRKKETVGLQSFVHSVLDLGDGEDKLIDKGADNRISLSRPDSEAFREKKKLAASFPC